MMKTRPACFILLIFLTACEPPLEKTLSSDLWVIVDVRVDGKPVETQRNGFAFTDRDGNELMFFMKEGNTQLPGLNSAAIPATWSIVNNQVLFGIDTSGLKGTVAPDLSFLASEPGGNADSLRKANENMSNDTLNAFVMELGELLKKNVTPELRAAIEMYREPFDCRFDNDTLVLSSSRVTLRLMRDMTIEELFKQANEL